MSDIYSRTTRNGGPKKKNRIFVCFMHRTSRLCEQMRTLNVTRIMVQCIRQMMFPKKLPSFCFIYYFSFLQFCAGCRRHFCCSLFIFLWSLRHCFSIFYIYIFLSVRRCFVFRKICALRLSYHIFVVTQPNAIVAVGLHLLFDVSMLCNLR